MANTKELLTLLSEFIRFGCFTFGGGWSIIAQMQQLYVEKKNTITAEELMDLTSVAKSLPGVMVANVAMLFGYRTAGLAGGLTAVLGLICPPVVILIAVSFCYDAFRTNPWVVAALGGMRAAVVPIIAGAAVGLARGSVKFPPCALVAAVCFLAYLFFQVNAVTLVAIGIVSGLVIGEYYERKGADGHGAS